MIPAGYMAKHIAIRPEWLKAERVVDIYSVSNCVSEDFADYIKYIV
jgi:predicted nicotinamide N-methyase